LTNVSDSHTVLGGQVHFVSALYKAITITCDTQTGPYGLFLSYEDSQLKQ